MHRRLTVLGVQGGDPRDTGKFNHYGKSPDSCREHQTVAVFSRTAASLFQNVAEGFRRTSQGIGAVG
jgi:hypothetical protein